MKAIVDRNACVGSAKCVRIAPRAFDLGSTGKAHVVDPDASSRTRLRKAARLCPTHAIILADEDGNQIFPPP
jgi:ferredoxin